MQDEEGLVRQARDGDTQALSALYEAYFDRIYRYVVFRIRDRAEAEDMTQQVFMKMVQSISSYRCQGVPFSAWLYRIARNQVIDTVRQRSKRTTVPLEEWSASSADDPQDVVEVRMTVEHLMAAATRLTAAQQEVMSLRFAGQLSLAECAQVMGKNENAIKALQHSAVVALRKLMKVSGDGED